MNIFKYSFYLFVNIRAYVYTPIYKICAKYISYVLYRTVLFILKCKSEFPRRLVKKTFWISGFWFSLSGWGLRICRYNKFPGDADYTNQGPHFEINGYRIYSLILFCACVLYTLIYVCMHLFHSCGLWLETNQYTYAYLCI